ncbi:MAG TPA: V-type ATP synthase subunit E [Methanolinea sp.]|nr:V-type ATP synthase subunit E [Methanolinea sp.]HQK55942.1 V-type ATP synthase subunit E [Methanolinea sp.]
MAIEELIRAVEVSAEERIKEIQERSHAEAEEMIREAKAKTGPMKSRYLEEAQKSVEHQRNRMLSLAREENRKKVIAAKNEILERAFEEASKALATIRSHPRYRNALATFINEVTGTLPAGDLILHVDPRDEAICREILRELKLDCEIISDLTCSGGVNASTRDERFLVLNTIEARIQRAKELYRPEISNILFG